MYNALSAGWTPSLSLSPLARRRIFCAEKKLLSPFMIKPGTRVKFSRARPARLKRSVIPENQRASKLVAK